MNEPKLGDQIWDERQGKWFTIETFCEDSGTRLNDGRWVCASRFEHIASTPGGRSLWKFDPDALSRDEVEPQVGDKVKTKLTWRTITEITERGAELDRLSKYVRLNDLSLIAARRSGGVTIWKLDREEEPGPYLPFEAPEPCWICGDEDDHLGNPHSVATGDGQVRADVAREAGGNGDLERKRCDECGAPATHTNYQGTRFCEPCANGDEPQPEPVTDYVLTDEVYMEFTNSGTRLYVGGQQMKLVPVDSGFDLGLCARVIELEAEVVKLKDLLRYESNRADSAIRREGVLEEVVSELGDEIDGLKKDLHRASSMLSQAIVENNKLRAELAEEVRKHNNTIDVAAGRTVDAEAANEKLAQIEEALEAPFIGDAGIVQRVAEILGD